MNLVLSGQQIKGAELGTRGLLPQKRRKIAMKLEVGVILLELLDQLRVEFERASKGLDRGFLLVQKDMNLG